MKLVSYQHDDTTWRAAEVRDGALYALGDFDVQDIIKTGLREDDAVGYLIHGTKTLRAPMTPGKILCVGRNYPEHVSEMGYQMPDQPLIFSKYPTSIIADGEAIAWSNAITQKVDWEGELGIVIGKRVKNIAEDEAMDAIFGYVVANDVSARDLQDSDKQWARAKGMDTFCPLGATLVTKDEIADPHNLTIETWVNGEQMQKGSTSAMFFKIPFLVAYLSQAFTLEPGDLILTGTPAGVGKGMTPPRFLKDGDRVTVTIEGVGSVTNTCTSS